MIIRTILIAFGIIVAALVVLVVRFFSNMKPVPTGEINPGVFALNHKMVNSFLYKTAHGYIAVDAGINPELTAMELAKLGIGAEEIHTVLFTHSDQDHVGGAAAFPKAKVYLPELEEQMINGTTLRMLFGRGRENSVPVPYETLTAGELCAYDDVSVLSVSVPGHTPGLTAYIIDGKFAFVGDMGIIKKGELGVSARVFNNDHEQARRTVDAFKTQFRNLGFIATAHGGVKT